MKKLVKLVLMTPILILLMLILIGTSYQIWYTEFRTPSGMGQWSSKSPDGRFIVTAYSNKGLRSMIPTMPGDGSFGPGIIILRDNKTGKILQKEEIENLAAIGKNNVEWIGDYVHIDFISPPWPLPHIDGTLPPSWREYGAQQVREFDMKNSAQKKLP
jgi:hypothetical protein